MAMRQLHALLEAHTGDSLSEADVQDLLLRTTEILGEPPRTVHGDGDSVFFRWYLEDGRTARSAPGHTVLDLTVPTRFGPHESVTLRESDSATFLHLEDRDFEWSEEIDDLPHQWSIEIGDPLVGTWTPGGREVLTWDDFSTAFSRTMAQMPTVLAVTPPGWRPEDVGLIWHTHASPHYQAVALYAEPEHTHVEGLLRSEDLESHTWSIPRAMLEQGAIDLTDVVAGLAGGAGLDTMGQLAAPGFLFVHSLPPAPEGGPDAFQPSHASTETRAGIPREELLDLIEEFEPTPPREHPRHESEQAPPAPATSPEDAADLLARFLLADDLGEAIAQASRERSDEEDDEAFELTAGLTGRGTPYRTKLDLVAPGTDPAATADYSRALVTALLRTTGGRVRQSTVSTTGTRSLTVEGPQRALRVTQVGGELTATFAEVDLLL